MRDTVRQAVGDAQTRPARSALAETERALQRKVRQLTAELGALLPKYWSWVEPSKYVRDRNSLLLLTQTAEEKFLDLPKLECLYRDLCVLEHTFTTALNGPAQRQRRKIFI